MTTNINKIICAICVICGFASCSEWDDHYEAAANSDGSGLTLWQQMEARPELSDFCKVLEQTKVFRMHRKTVVSYADLLGSGQSFTVVAPKNGTFNLDSLLNLVQTNQGDSVVEKFFVLNHISRSATSLTETQASNAGDMLLLNKKHVALQGNAIQGVAKIESNIHAKNGVLHIASTPLPYHYNLYEALCDMPELSAIGSYLKQYDEDWFDADNSVSSGIIEGVPVYVDSVVVERNRMLQRIGLINDEDSVYWVVAPTNESWNKVWEATSQYFQYDATVLKRDSIQQYWTNRALLDDAIFNMTDQKSTNDSLISVPYLNWRRSWTQGKPEFHVFRKPFATGGILYGAEPTTCSNGMLYKVEEWPFTPEQTFLKELWSEAESGDLLITEYKDCMYNTRSQVADSISDNGYLQIVPRTATSNWELTFRMNSTLSADYDICAIVLPKTITGQKDVDMNPCKFKAVINYVDLDGKKQTFNCGGTEFQNDPEKVDTVVLAEAFHIPACNYDQNEIKVSVKLQCSITARQTSRYAREMYLDCIYLRPVTPKAE